MYPPVCLAIEEACCVLEEVIEGAQYLSMRRALDVLGRHTMRSGRLGWSDEFEGPFRRFRLDIERSERTERVFYGKQSTIA